MDKIKYALQNFTQKYQQAWLLEFGHLPKSEELYGIVSPCIVEAKDMAILWQSVPSQTEQSLSIVEEVIGITIISSAHVFYGLQYAGDMSATFDGHFLSLVQIWSDDDFSRLEQNMIAHLSMQKRLKRRPTIFIASTRHEDQIISIDNQTGAIVLEKLIENKTEVLADDLGQFLARLTPVAG